MEEKCIVCGEKDKLNLKQVEYKQNTIDRWWMCLRCIQDVDGFEKAKTNFYGKETNS